MCEQKSLESICFFKTVLQSCAILGNLRTLALLRKILRIYWLYFVIFLRLIQGTTVIKLLNLMIMFSLFYADLNDACPSSIKMTRQPGLRANLHGPRITALRLPTRIITIFSFDRTRKSKSFSFPIFFMILKSQNKTSRAIEKLQERSFQNRTKILLRQCTGKTQFSPVFM